MRNIYLTVLLALFATTQGLAQSWHDYFPENGFQKHIFKICRQTPDGGYIFAGRHNNISQTGDIYMVRTDALGNTLWADTLVLPGYQDSRDMILTQDGGFIVVAVDEGNGGPIVKYDDSGNVVWMQQYSSTAGGDPYGLVELQDGSIVVWGASSATGTTGGYDGCLVKYDSDGNEIWTRFHGSPGTDQGRGIVATDDGGFVLAGYKTTATHRDLWHLKVNDQGFEQWSNTYNWPGFTTPSSISVITTPDGGYALCGMPSQSALPRIYKTDANGGLQWWEEIGENGDDFTGSWLVRDHDSGYLLAGTSNRFSPTSHTDAIIVKIDENGQEEWYQDYGTPLHDGGWNIRTTSDGGYILCGYAASSVADAAWSAFAVKIGQDGTPCEETELNVEICPGDDFTVGTSTYTQEGSYFDTYLSSSGCDSVVNTILSFADHQIEQSIGICSGQQFTVGTSTYTQTGTYVDVLTASDGCDSTVTTFLDVGVATFHQSVTICNGETFSVGTSTYSFSGFYTDEFVATAGCDSIVTTSLTVIPELNTAIDVSLCVGEEFGGTTYNLPGLFQEQVDLTSTSGCDSTVVYNISVGMEYDTTITTTICAGGGFTVGSFTYDQTGTYVNHLYTSSQCDSIVTLDLTVLPGYSQTINASICEGETFTVGSGTYGVTGTYVEEYTAAGGCDSTITINLNVTPTDVFMEADICAGETFSVGSNTYDQTGQYVDSLIAVNGCDSIVHLDLEVFTSYETLLEVAICEGESFSVGSSTYTEPGTYTNTYTAVGGCDSIITTEIVWDVEYDPFGNPLVSIQGNVFQDDNGACVFDGSETPLSTWVVEAQGSSTLYGTTNSAGEYAIEVPFGTYQVSSQTPVNWDNCGPDFQTVTIDGSSGCSETVDFPLIPEFGCGLLDVDLSVICLVPCSASTYHLNYHNVGTETAYNPTLTFVAGPHITVNSSTEPWETPQNGNIYQFQLDSVEAGASGWIGISVTVDCDPTLFGYAVCSGVIHDPTQCCSVYDQYMGPEVAIEAECVNGDSVEFIIQNIGADDMPGLLEYIILQDDIVYLQGNFQLGSGEEEIVAVPAFGSAYRMEAQQVPGHPFASAPSVAIEACGVNAQGLVSLGFTDVLDNGDLIPWFDFDCTVITPTCECNLITPSPIGVGPDAFIEQDEQLEYIITFQNPTTDPVEEVVVKSRLSEHHDPKSVIRGEASHEMDFTVTQDGLITWRMSDINLGQGSPDSELNSGFVKFTVDLREGVPVGTVIYSEAEIEFDSATAFITNEVFHTVGQRKVDFLVPLSVEDILDPNHQLTVFPNPFGSTTTIEITGVVGRIIELELLDLTGKIVQQVSSSDHIIQLSRNGLDDGVYIYRVVSDEQLLGTGKLVVGGQ